MLSVIVIEPPDRVVLPGGATAADRLVAQIEGLLQDGQLSFDGPIQRVASGDLPDLVRRLGGGGDVVVIDGGAVMHAPALRAVIGDGRISTGVLVARGADGDYTPGPLKLDRDGTVVLRAGSPLHDVGATNARAMGVLRLDALSASVVADAVSELLRQAPEPQFGRLGHGTVDVLTACSVAAGVRLRPVDLRRMQAFRPTGPSETVRALRACEDRDEDRAWLDAAVKAKDGWFTTFFVSPYSRYVARWSARLGLSPNQVTTLSALVGAGAAAAFALGTLTAAIIGAVALQIAFMLDCVDGQLSRYTQRFSTFGAWLDSMLDRGKELLVYLGLAIGGLRADEADIWLLLVASAALLVLRHSVDISYEAARPTPPLDPAPLRRYEADVAADHAAPDAGQAAAAGNDVDAASSTRPGLSLGRLARSRPAMWLLRFLAFPIGERFAAISLLAVFTTRRTTFLVLLVWGIIAWAASIVLKLARSRRWTSHRFGWLVAAAPRLLEYGTVVGIALILPETRPATFALIFALGMRHYDEGYRARTLGASRTDALTRAVLSAWHARIVVLVLGAGFGLAVPVTWALTGIIAVLAAIDLVRAWLPTSTSNGSPR